MVIFDLNERVFIPVYSEEVELKDNQFLIQNQEDINAISASITGNGEIWVENGQLMTSGKAPSNAHSWDSTTKEWQLDETKAEALKTQQRTEMRTKINALRDEKINGGVYVEPLEKWIDSDATAERNLLSVKASFDLMGDMEIAWTCADNSLLMLNKEKLLLIWAVLMKEKTGNHANALQHKAAMEQADNPLEYDYSGGWSKTYGEFLAENATEKGAE